jgi:hypothetical protein
MTVSPRASCKRACDECAAAGEGDLDALDDCDHCAVVNVYDYQARCWPAIITRSSTSYVGIVDGSTTAP